MADDRSGSDRLERLAHALRLPLLTLLFVAMLLPGDAMRWLRMHAAPFNWAMGWIELASTRWNLIHVLLFGVVAFLLAARRELAWGRLLASLAVLAVATELAQFLVPGRTPRVADLGNDAIGAAVGLLAALVLRAIARRRLARRIRDQARAQRQWLSNLLGIEPPLELPSEPDSIGRVLAAAVDEQVVGLAHARLAELSGSLPVPAVLLAAFAGATRAQAVQGMAYTVECRRLLDVFAAIEVDALLLKGAALSSWLYGGSHLRHCGDIDVLVASRAEAERALAALEAAGYRPRCRSVPGDLVAHELVLYGPASATGPSEVDLHWRCTSALFANVLGWHELRRTAMPLPELHPWAFALSPEYALLHASLNRGIKLQFGRGDRLGLLIDVRRLSECLDATQWHEFCRLAIERRVAGVCLDALASARTAVCALVPESVESTLSDAATHEPLEASRLRSWSYTQFAIARTFPDWRTRLRWFRQRMIPDRAYLLEAYGEPGDPLVLTVLKRLRAGLRRLLGGGRTRLSGSP